MNIYIINIHNISRNIQINIIIYNIIINIYNLNINKPCTT